MSESLLILHLSDLHITDVQCRAADRVSKIAGSIGSLWSEGCQLVILISGDVAYSGGAEEYNAATVCLEGLIESLKRWRFAAVRVFAVPGNHDCDFKKIQSVVQDALLGGISKAHGADATSIVEELVKTQAEFEIFTGVVCGHSAALNGVVSMVELELGPRTLSLLLVNSAWSSRLKEKPGELRMPADVLPEVRCGSELSIAVAHHPLNWFTPEDGKSFSEWLDRNADLALWGHEHREDDFTVRRKRFGSSVRHLLALPMDDDVSVCGFRCMRLSADSDEIEIHGFEWRLDKVVRLPVEVEPVPRNPARSIGQIRFSSIFKEFIDDVGGAFKHPRLSRPISLSDIYVAPEFKSFDSAKSEMERVDSQMRVDSVYEEIFSHEKTVVFGPEQSGKTTFAKSLMSEARHRGVTALYFDAHQLSSANRGEITAWISAQQTRQFEVDCLEDVKCLPPHEKLVIIDSLDQVAGGDAACALIVERLARLASRVVILTSQAPAIAMIASNLSSGDEGRVYWQGAKWFELLSLGHKRRGELIRRWSSLGRDLLLDSELIESEVRQIKQLLDKTLGKNFMPKFPFFLLIILQQIETYRDNKTVVTNGSHGHLFEALIVQALDRHVTVHAISTVHDFLARFAFTLWSRGESSLSERLQEQIISDFRSTRLVALNHRVLMDQLDEARIIRLDVGGATFRYQYLFYYYLARWIGANRGSESADGLMQHLAEYIHTERSSNVVMFLTHLGHEEWVLQYILPLAKDLFRDHVLAKLESRSALAGKFNDSKSRQVLLLGDPAKVSDHHHSREDDIDGERDATDSESLEEDTFKFNTATRVIQVLGYILKSRAGGVSAEDKLEVAEEAISLARRLMTVLYDVVEASADELARSASDAFERRMKMDPDAAVSVARRFVGAIVSGISKVLVGKTADSFASAELLPLIDELDARSGTDKDVGLFVLVARLVAEPSYPADKVDDFLYRLKASDVLSHSTVAWAVSRQFYLQPPSHGLRDSVCRKLGIEIRRLPPVAAGKKYSV